MSSSAALSAAVSDSLLRCPVVSELLLTALSGAAGYGRLIFDQPIAVTATDERGEQQTFLTNGAFDTAKLLSIENAIPPFDELQRAASNHTLAAELDALDPLILPLLDWTLHNPNVYIRQLEADERFASIPTDQQFAVCMPSKEALFIRARREQAARRGVAEEEAVTWYFHGSPNHNWHSILRTGLKNLSHTEWMTSQTTAHDTVNHRHSSRLPAPLTQLCSLMTCCVVCHSAGASHGCGIYLAPHSSTSLTYAPITVPLHKADLPRCHLIALCEALVVVTAPNSKAFVVIPQNERVCLRFLFALPESSGVAVTAQQLVSEMSIGLKYSLQYPL